MDQLKRQARVAVQKAVAQGLLHRPIICQVCDSDATKEVETHTGLYFGQPRRWVRYEAGAIVAHHWAGYAPENWLNIWWVCTRCNARLTQHDGSQTLDQARAYIANYLPPGFPETWRGSRWWLKPLNCEKIRG